MNNRLLKRFAALAAIVMIVVATLAAATPALVRAVAAGVNITATKTQAAIGDTVTTTVTSDAPAQGDQIVVASGAALQFDAAKTLSANNMTALSTSDYKIEASSGQVVITQLSATPLKALQLVFTVTAALGNHYAVTSTLNGSQSKSLTLSSTTFKPTDYSFAIRSVSDTDNAGAVYWLSDFPLFYLKDSDPSGTPTYSWMTNGAQSPNATLYKAVLNQTRPYNATTYGSARGTSNQSYGNYFHQFSAVNTDGTIPTGATAYDLQADHAYQMYPYNPVVGTSASYYRIDTGMLSVNYYMPDGAPSFTVDGSGALHMTANDGRAVPGLFTTQGKKILYNALKVKGVKIVDASGNVIKGAKLNLTGTNAGTTGMVATMGGTAKTRDGSVDLLVPAEYKEDSNGKGPFYFPAGKQTFSSITGADSYYLSGGSFAVSMDANTDELQLTGDNPNVTLDAAKQVLTVQMAKKTMTVKKVGVDAATVGLSGAQLKVTPVDSGGSATGDSHLFTTGSDGTAAWQGSLSDGNYKVEEVVAPSGYTIDPQPYYFTWSAASGVTRVGASAGAITQTSMTNASGTTLAISNGQLVYGDVKPAAMQDVHLKTSVLAVGSIVAPNVPLSLTEYTNATTPGTTTSGTTDANGELTLPVKAGASANTVRIFKVTQPNNPTAYAPNAQPYYIAWSAAKGVTAVASDYATAAKNAQTATKDKLVTVDSGSDGGVANFALAQQYPIHVRLQTPGGTQAAAGVKVTLTSRSGGDGKLTLTTDASGDVYFNTLQMATLATTNTTVFDPRNVTNAVWGVGATVDASGATINGQAVQVANPLPRMIRFWPNTYGFSSSNNAMFNGFSAYGETSGVPSDPATQPQTEYDGAFTDSLVATDTAPGDLSINLRQDVVRAQDMLTPATGVPSTYTVKFFSASGVQVGATQNVSAGATGIASLSAAVNGVASQLTPGTTYTVQVAQTGATGYTPISAPQTLTYSSTAGFSTAAASATTAAGTAYVSGLPSVTTAARMHWQNTDNTVSTDSFQPAAGSFAAGSQIVYNLKQASQLTLDSYPQVMNFGSEELTGGGQDVTLKTPTQLEAAGYPESTWTTIMASADDPTYVGTQVTQVGDRSHWHLDVQADSLSHDTDQLSGVTLNFADGMYRRDTAPLASDDPAPIAFGADASTQLQSSDGDTPGVYRIFWKAGDVKLHVPADSGVSATDYRGQTTWTLVEDVN